MIIGFWAAFESSIDRANSLAWRYSDKSISKVVPQSLRWKLQTFERIHKKLLPFSDLRTQASAILRDMNELKDDRHWLAHGGMIATKSGGDGWTLEKTVFQTDGSVTFERRRFTKDEMSAITRKVQKLGLKVARYTNTVAWKIGHEPSDDSRS